MKLTAVQHSFLTQDVLQQLLNRNVTSVSAFLGHSPSLLSAKCSLNLEQIFVLRRFFAKQFQSSQAKLNSSNPKTINIDILGGSLESDKLYELYGLPGRGKTQIAMFLSAKVANQGRTVLYIDAKNDFSLNRLSQFCKSQDSRQNVRLAKAFDMHEAIRLTTQLSNLGSDRTLNVGLVVLDNIASLVWPLLEDDGLTDASAKVGLLVRNLRRIAYRLDCPVLVINNATNHGKKAALGKLFADAARIKFHIERDSSLKINRLEAGPSMGLTEIVGGLADNPYFGAGFGLFGLGAVAAVTKKASQLSVLLFKRHYMTTVEVTCQDKSFQWLLQWMTRRGAKETQHLSVETSFVETESGKVMTRYDFQPSVGTHFMKFNGTWIQVERTRENRLAEPWETVTLTTLGRQKKLFGDILDDARQMALNEFSGKTVMYTVIGTQWIQFGHPRQRRPLESVVLPQGQGGEILQDVRDFIDNSEWYRSRGIPYRRGYLLYGPPGCGKTSFITALAGELHYSICVLNLSDRSMSDDRLSHRLADAPQNSIILLEDVDAVFVSRDDPKHQANEAAYQGLNRLTLSGLLNAIDGVTSTEGRIMFMTTNYVDRLDPALIRPGRIDMKVYIGFCDHYQCQLMFKRFYPEEPNELAMEFADKVAQLETPVSAAQIQGLFMFFKANPRAAIDNVFRFKPPQDDQE